MYKQGFFSLFGNMADVHGIQIWNLAMINLDNLDQNTSERTVFQSKMSWGETGNIDYCAILLLSSDFP